jgi:hypothetical protein
VLLGVGSGFVNILAALASSLGQLLALVLNLGVQPIEDGEDGALELFCRLVVLVGDALGTVSAKSNISTTVTPYLRVRSDVFKHASNSSE